MEQCKTKAKNGFINLKIGGKYQAQVQVQVRGRIPKKQNIRYFFISTVCGIFAGFSGFSP